MSDICMNFILTITIAAILGIVYYVGKQELIKECNNQRDQK